MNPFAVEARIKDLADTAATEFLSPLAQKVGSPDFISKNAEKILKESGANLTKIVAKIASDENLNPHELARVCEESNKEVFGRLYKGSDDKTFEFGVADANEALRMLDRVYEGPGDVFLPVEHPKYASVKTASAKKAGSETSWARTALYPSVDQAAILQMQEYKDAHASFRELQIESETSRHQAALDFAKVARDLVLEEGCSPSVLFALVKEARPGSPLHEKVARELLALVAISTSTRFPEGAEEVVKYAKALLENSETAAGKMPSDDLRDVSREQYEFWTRSPGQQPEAYFAPLSSAGDPARLINGRHKLFVTLDTLIDQTGKEKAYEKGSILAADQVRTIVRNVVNWKGKTENVD